MVKASRWVGSLPRLLRALLAALAGVAFPGGGRPTERPPTAAGAQLAASKATGCTVFDHVGGCPGVTFNYQWAQWENNAMAEGGVPTNISPLTSSTPPHGVILTSHL